MEINTDKLTSNEVDLCKKIIRAIEGCSQEITQWVGWSDADWKAYTKSVAKANFKAGMICTVAGVGMGLFLAHIHKVTHQEKEDPQALKDFVNSDFSSNEEDK